MSDNKKIAMKPNQAKNGKLSLMTTLELAKEQRSRKLLLMVFAILIAFMVCVAILTTIKKGFSFFTFFPLFFAPILVTKWMSYKAVNDEIKAREIQ